MTRANLLITILAFVAGWAVAKHMSKDPEIQGSPAVAISVSAPAPAPSSHVAPATVTPTIPRGPNHIVGPADGDPILELMRNRFPEAKIVVTRENPDGTFLSRETLGDGGTITREFNRLGNLVKEDWKMAIGDEAIRTYSDSGFLRAFSLQKTEGSVTNVTLTESGVFKSRTDHFADGTLVETHYDDQGQVRGR